MKSNVGHMQFNVNPANKGFYKDLLSFLGWDVLYEDENMVGLGAEHGMSLWFAPVTKDNANHYDGPGLNHLAIGVEKQADVDAAAEFLGARGVAMLFETPRHRPDFSSGPESTYYQIMFESPDRILLEVVYTGLKS